MTYRDAHGSDAPDIHVYLGEWDPIGGWVCAECGWPTESEPCEDHQPEAYAAIEPIPDTKSGDPS